MHPRSVQFFFVGAVCLALTACAGSPDRGQPTAGRYATNGTFTAAIKDDVGSFNPYHSQLAFGIVGLAYDSLVNLRPDGSFVSGLAEKWQVAADSATFTLRNGITCSDGAPLTADQVAADLEYLADPKNQSPQYGVFVPTVPFSVKSDNTARTVKITMKSPFGFLLNTIGQVPIVCAKGLKDQKLLASGSAGTGPFVLTTVVPGQSYTFTVRKGYTWGPGGAGTNAPGTPAKIVIRIIGNETVAANLLLSGEINTAQVSGEDRRRLGTAGLAKVERNNGIGLKFNQRDGRPTADRRVRRALVQALDMSQIIKVTTGGTGRAATGNVAFTPNPCPGDNVTGQLPAHDSAAAERLLDAAGWVKGADGIRRKNNKPLSLDLHFTPALSPFDAPTIELLAQQWKRIGVTVKRTPDTFVAYNKVLYESGEWDVYLAGYGFNLPSQVVPFVSGATPPKGTNSAGIENKEYNALVAKAQQLTPPRACALWNDAERKLYRNADLAPIAFRSTFGYLKNAQANAAGISFLIPTSIRLLKTG